VNFRYTQNIESPLTDIIARNPGASLQDLRRSHPLLRKMSLDHLALRLDEIHRRNTAWQK
jgi:hypothetical protein